VITNLHHRDLAYDLGTGVPSNVDGLTGSQEDLFFGLLGPLAGWRDGRPLELGTPQQRRVLAHLLLRRNEIVGLDHLVEALWGATPPANAIQAVRTYVSRLRTCFGSDAHGEESLLVTHRGGYRLAVRDEEMDVDLFESLALAGHAALEMGAANKAEAQLREALALVRGPPLAGMEHDEFCRYEAERLNELQLLVYEDLVEARLAQGEHRELISELRAAVSEHPFRERFWAQLMLALYRSGRQAEALEAYQQARRLLAEKLGLEPSQELRMLERMILLQEETLDHRAVGRMHGVPRYPTRFVGRHEEVEELRKRLTSERLVTLVGPPGTGKTRLAVEVTAGLRGTFPDGIWWVGLTPATAQAVPAAFASSLSIREAGKQSAEDRVVARLRGARILLVADNCEHVSQGVAALARRVLCETETARLLATSREPLRVAGEGVHLVPPLAVPPARKVPARELIGYESAQLFVDRAAATTGSFELDEPCAAAIARVVERLDGLPLAIELAAGKLRSLSLPELAGLLDERLGLLGDGERTAPARHRTLEAAIEWSFDLLTDDERAVLLRLSAFPGTFDAAAAEAVAAGRGLERGAVVPLLTRLVDKSLVSVEVGEPSRYRLLWTVRAFALARARATDELEHASRRHRDHYTAAGEQVWRHMIDSGLASWLIRVRDDEDNFRAALRWSLEHGDGEAAVQLASALAGWWFRSGQLSEGLELLKRALDVAGERSSRRPRALVGKALLSLSVGAPDAYEAAEAAVAACEETDPEFFALALVFRAQAQIGQGWLDRAEESIERARPIFHELAHPEAHYCDQLMGGLCLRRGDLEGARSYLVRAVEGYRTVRHPLDAGWPLVEVARVELAAGRLDDAEAWANHAVKDFRARGDRRGLASAFTCLGRIHAERGDGDRARLFLEEALELTSR
jgi:predicted ATPase/DNA-binding SARP family transcriptional activator